MKVSVLGCRGSYPVASQHTTYYGGDTTCVEIHAGNSLLILDAGTGIRKHQLSAADAYAQVHLFITHLHWDHIIGFPQWPLLWSNPGVILHIYALARSHNRFYHALERSISEPFENYSIKDVPAQIKYHELHPGDRIEIDADLSVTSTYANHPFRALAYRVDHLDQAFVFAPDTAPFDRYLFEEKVVFLGQGLTSSERQQLVQMQDAFLRLVSGSTWLYYDAMLTTQEYEALPHWGHSTMEQAVEVARAGNVDELILAHHAPQRGDEQINTMLETQRQMHPDMHLHAAYAGMILTREHDHAG